MTFLIRSCAVVCVFLKKEKKGDERGWCASAFHSVYVRRLGVGQS